MKKKVCKECGIEKPISEYHVSSKVSGVLHPSCKDCSAKYAREYRQSRRDYVAEYKMSKGCELCGFIAENSCQLDLHHINPDEKTYKGSHKSYDAGWSLERINLELAKCLVVCKNCHALETHKLGHWKNPTTDISMRQSSTQQELYLIPAA